jgi:hypothetical protein
MDNNAIIDAIGEVETALTSAGLGKIYDHVPAKPAFPCVIIAPVEPFITSGQTYLHRLVNLDVWIIPAPTPDNKALQENLYIATAKAITALEAVSALEFDEVGQPTPVEYNQARTLAITITINITL